VRWLVLVLALALPATAAAATTTLDDQSVSQIARADARMAQVQRLHPLAVWRPSYRPGSHTWVARLQQPVGSVLATLTVRDRDSKVTGVTIAPGALDTHLLTQSRAEAVAGTSAKVRDWMARYQRAHARITSSTAFEHS